LIYLTTLVFPSHSLDNSVLPPFLNPTISPYFLLRFEELFFTSSPETVTLYLPSSLLLRTFSQVSKSACIQFLIVFKADVSFIHSSLYQALSRQNGTENQVFPKVVTCIISRIRHLLPDDTQKNKQNNNLIYNNNIMYINNMLYKYI